MSGKHANEWSYEENLGLSGTVTHNLPWPQEQWTIINDDDTRDLLYKFNDSSSYKTIRPTETVSLNINRQQLILQSTGAIYRVWTFG